MRLNRQTVKGNTVVIEVEVVEAEDEEAIRIEIEGQEIEVGTGTKIKVTTTITLKITKIIMSKTTTQIMKEKTRIFPIKNLVNKIAINN